MTALASTLPGLRPELLGQVLLVGLLVVTLVLLWPPRRRWVPASTALGTNGGRGSTWRSPLGGGGDGDNLTPSSVWRQDPVVLYRTWRLRHDPDVLLAGVLDLLDAMSPALALGLTPARALSLAIAASRPTPDLEPDARARRVRPAELDEPDEPDEYTAPTAPTGTGGKRRRFLGAHAAGGDGRERPGRGRAGVADVDRLLTSLTTAADHGVGLADVWAQWARLTRSSDLAFVASAWSLSEHHGAPLAVAVERAAAGLREARARRRRVAVAVAGPRATVTVLTLLPLAGPAFGAACGIDPATLYLSSPLATAGAVTGVLLIVVGRLWCRAMIGRAVAA
ncbi:MAG: Type secretion system domain [Humibacillus sp.]|nr:Type secretion system domain [Humibacillus sp.]